MQERELQDEDCYERVDELVPRESLLERPFNAESWVRWFRKHSEDHNSYALRGLR